MAQFTSGPWHSTNHFADAEHRCGCAYILSEGYCGSICQISFDNGKAVGDGGNDSPPIAEAAANSHLIAAAPDLYEALQELVEAEDLVDADWSRIFSDARRTLAKARGEAA